MITHRTDLVSHPIVATLFHDPNVYLHANVVKSPAPAMNAPAPGPAEAAHKIDIPSTPTIAQRLRVSQPSAFDRAVVPSA